MLVAEHPVQNLADGAHRERVADVHEPRHLVLGQALAAEREELVGGSPRRRA